MRKLTRHALVFVVVGLLGIETPFFAQQLSKDTTDQVRQACVEVHVDGQLRGGGAFVKDSAGRVFVLTASHLFSSSKATPHVLTQSNEFLDTRIVAYDLGFDLALLALSSTPKRSLHPLSIAEKIPSEGAALYNFGPALRRRILVISGNVADARISYTDFPPYDGYLGHFFVAGISPELTSGGIWVNAKGAIVGVQNGRLKGDAGAPSSGLSMASPPQAIANLVESKTIASTPGIGGWLWELWNVDPGLLKRLPSGTRGLLVSFMQRNGPLEKCGVKLHDIVTHCDGQPVLRHDDFVEKIRLKPSGTVFSLTVISGKTRSVKNLRLQTESLEKRWK